ncbi:MAG: biotin/lipoyl-containing protein, partial [Malacoplasma sp.]
MYKFKFADIGEGIHEGKVGEIFVKEGQPIKDGENLFIVETDKVTTEITSPTNGTISKILIKTGSTVHVGDEIFYIDDGVSNESQKETTS